MMKKRANGQFALGHSVSSDKKVLICKGKMVATINQVSAATLEPADLCNQEPQTGPISESQEEMTPFEDDPMLCRILKETLIMEHPAGNGDLTQRTLLEIPWRFRQPGWIYGLRPQNYKPFGNRCTLVAIFQPLTNSGKPMPISNIVAISFDTFSQTSGRASTCIQ